MLSKEKYRNAVVRPNPGTVEGRKLGGLRSLETHKKRNTGFKLLKKVQSPRKTAILAELVGVLMGDGHVGKYQVSLVTNAETDSEHASHVSDLLCSQFGVPVSITRRRDSNALIVLLSSKSTCDHLERLGMPRGNKLAKGLYAPDWIAKNPIFVSAFLRGLVDTDGCVYTDQHTIKGKTYSSLCIAFTSASEPLLDFVYNTLRNRGFSPSRWGRHVRLRRKKDVYRYAEEIGFSNPKHRRKIEV